jgi:hypothetical protein
MKRHGMSAALSEWRNVEPDQKVGTTFRAKVMLNKQHV